MLRCHEIVNTILQSVTYILHDDNQSDAILIDCGDISPILHYLTDNKINRVFVLLTHTHYDHIYGLNDLLFHYPSVVVYTNKFGQEALYDDIMNLSFCYDLSYIYQGEEVKIVSDNDEIMVGNNSVMCIETPGHDKTCVSYKIGNHLFTGDSYIPNHEVVTCWKNSNKQQALESLNHIATFDAIIKPGHRI